MADPNPSSGDPPAAAGRHRVISAGTALAVVLAGGALLWGSALRDVWGLVKGARATAGPEEAPPQTQSMQVRLAFLAPDGRTLQEEPRELTLRSSAPAAARAILEALRAGSRQGRGAVLPAGLQVRHVFLDKRGVAYVDLSQEFLRPTAAAASPDVPTAPSAEQVAPGGAEPSVPAGGAGLGGERAGGEAPWGPTVLAARAMAATLGMSLPEVAEVQFLVEGRVVPVVADGVDLRRPIPASLRSSVPSAQP